MGLINFSYYNEKDKPYSINKIIWRFGILYKSFIDNNNTDPATDSTNWAIYSWDENKQYSQGDTVYHGYYVWFEFTCKKDCTGQPPFSRIITDDTYGVAGYCDSIYRFYKFVDERIKTLDSLMA